MIISAFFYRIYYTMKFAKIKNTDLEVSKICFGGNVFGWTLDEKQSFNTLNKLEDYGIQFIDTANNYSHWAPGNHGGESELIIGKWLKKSKKRHDVVLATKVGGGFANGDFKGLAPENIKTCVEDSLIRLNTDYIDLYQIHHDDLNISIPEMMVSLNELIKEGKVRYIGVSNMTAYRITEAMEYAKENKIAEFVSLQPHLNLLRKDQFSEKYLSLLEDYSLEVLPYFSLASGFLTGKYRSIDDLEGQARKDMVKTYAKDQYFKLIDYLEELSKIYNTSIASLSLAWLLEQKYVLSPIVSTTKESQLKDLANSIHIQWEKEHLENLNNWKF